MLPRPPRPCAHCVLRRPDHEPGAGAAQDHGSVHRPARPYTGYHRRSRSSAAPERPGRAQAASPAWRVRANSWATGTSPDVRTVYLRLLAENPSVEDHAYDLAQAGADLSRIRAQAERSSRTSPTSSWCSCRSSTEPCVPRQRGRPAFFENELTASEVDDQPSPARIFLTNRTRRRPQRSEDADAGRTPATRRDADLAFFDLTGRIVPRKLTRLDASLPAMWSAWERSAAGPPVRARPRGLPLPRSTAHSAAGPGPRLSEGPRTERCPRLEGAWRARLVPPVHDCAFGAGR